MALLAYNTSVHIYLVHPFYLVFGRQARLPIDWMYGTGDTAGGCTHGYAVHLKENFEKAYRLVRERLSASHERHKDYL